MYLRKDDNMEEIKNMDLPDSAEKTQSEEQLEGLKQDVQGEQPPVKKKWFGRGIYGSKDVPIKILDKLILGLIVATVVLTVVFTVNGGYFVNFDTGGGTEIESQKLRYGQLVEKPEDPVRPGYEFTGWIYGEEEYPWSFGADKVQGEMNLIAQWKPAKVLVKFDLDGGTFGKNPPEEFFVTFGEPYGPLPVPEKEGAEFDCWVYSGAVVDENTPVTMTGEHVLTALWK